MKVTYVNVDIENFCLNLNCTSLLPGAAVDTCQLLSMTRGSDLANWIPDFDIFKPDFELGTYINRDTHIHVRFHPLYLLCQKQNSIIFPVPPPFLSKSFKIDADDVPWKSLNYEEPDWDNFNVSAIQWKNPDMMTNSWTDLIGGDFDLGDGVSGIISSGVCKLMSQVVKLTDELGIEGSCTCDEIDGLAMSCDFLDLCIETKQLMLTTMHFVVVSI